MVTDCWGYICNVKHVKHWSLNKKNNLIHAFSIYFFELKLLYFDLDLISNFNGDWLFKAHLN